MSVEATMEAGEQRETGGQGPGEEEKNTSWLLWDTGNPCGLLNLNFRLTDL